MLKKLKAILNSYTDEELESYYYYKKRVTKLKYSKKLVVTSRSALID